MSFKNTQQRIGKLYNKNYVFKRKIETTTLHNLIASSTQKNSLRVDIKFIIVVNRKRNPLLCNKTFAILK